MAEQEKRIGKGDLAQTFVADAEEGIANARAVIDERADERIGSAIALLTLASTTLTLAERHAWDLYEKEARAEIQLRIDKLKSQLLDVAYDLGRSVSFD